MSKRDKKEIYPKMLILVGGGLNMNSSPVLFCVLFITPYMNADFLKNEERGRGKARKRRQERSWESLWKTA